MQVKALLNSVHPIKGFVYESVGWDTPGVGLQAAVRSRKNSRGVCSGCGRRGRTYDHRRPRRAAKCVMGVVRRDKEEKEILCH